MVTDKFLLPGEEGTFNCDGIVREILGENPQNKENTETNLEKIKAKVLEKNPKLLPYACITSGYDVPKLLDFMKA